MIYLTSVPNNLTISPFDSSGLWGYDAGLMVTETLTAILDLPLAAKKHQHWQGRVEVTTSELRPARDDILSEQVPVDLDFTVDSDDKGRPRLRGQVRAAVKVVCQRCLQPVVFALEAQLRLVALKQLTDDDELPDEYEPLLVPDGELALTQLAQEELLLNLPIIVKHQPNECAAQFEDAPLDNKETRKSLSNLQQLLEKKNGRSTNS
jgi:uncharacterized protein